MTQRGFYAVGMAGLRMGLGLVFVYAGIVKLQAPGAFAAAIAAYRLVPDTWASEIASALPFFEAIAGFWLALGWRHRTPALAILLLAIVFIFALGQASVRGLDVACGCFRGTNSPPTTLWLPLARDALLLAGAWLVFRDVSQRDSSTSPSDESG